MTHPSTPNLLHRLLHLPSSARIWLPLALLLASSLALSACDDAPPDKNQTAPTPTLQAPRKPGEYPPVLPTATVPGKPSTQPGRYDNPDRGITLTYPSDWEAKTGSDSRDSLLTLTSSLDGVVAGLFYSPMPSDTTLEKAAQDVVEGFSSGLDNVKQLGDEAFTIADGREARMSAFTGDLKSDGAHLRILMVSSARGGRIFSLWASVDPSDPQSSRQAVESLFKGMSLTAPEIYGIERDQALFLEGGESNNPRNYDPATSHADSLVFSGLVTLNPQLEVTPDLAESWDVSPDGKVYTFHLRKNARFHNGRPVTAGDVVYSWERAADPSTNSDIVLTYMGDIVGLTDKRAGKAKTISGLKALNSSTLQVTIDAPKPYFLMKLTYGTSVVLDRANVESGPSWYKTPNGTGPYKLIRWESGKAILYERNADFYLKPPDIPYVVIQLYAGAGMRLYETGDVDITGVPQFDVERVRDPKEPLHADLHEGVSMCTQKISFDVTQPPFDDPKVRQAFALSIDRQRYVDVVMYGAGLPAHGLYPPALPGYNPNLKGLDFNPQLARQRLSESRYGSADKLPPIIFTSSGFGSDVDSSLSALADMWQKNLGVTIQVENLEPDKAQDEIHAGRHGQLFYDGWCADYPDPENFADALYHSGAQQNVGHYSNPALDKLLEQARIERDVTKRIVMYGKAEQLIVDDAASVFLSHSLSYTLIKPQIKGYTYTPINIPIARYLSLDPSKLK